MVDGRCLMTLTFEFVSWAHLCSVLVTPLLRHGYILASGNRTTDEQDNKLA